MSTSRLVFPVEIYDEIISFVTSTKDLLNLSLTCRRLSKLIIPNHIDYRAVVCSTFDTFVWEHFLSNPHLAKRIYSIKILDDLIFQDGAEIDAKMERRVIPRQLQMLSARELKTVLQLKGFTESIHVMKNLYSFDYRGPCPAFMLFTHLAHHATGLRIFKYSYEWTGLNHASQLGDFIDSASQVNKGFEYLKYCSLDIRFHGKYDNHTNILLMINHLLENNHSIESLTLFVWDPHSQFITLPRFLLDANWPKIHTLALGGDLTILKEDSNIDLQLRISQTQSFFSKHASLERVRLWDSGNNLIYPGTIEPDMLPKLHTLDLDFHMPYPISELIPENMINRLVNLSVNLSNVPDSFITSGYLKNIRRLYTAVSSYDCIPLLLEATPKIERLWVELSIDRWGVENTEILRLLPDFKKYSKYLTHLSLPLPLSRRVLSHAEALAPEKYAQELDKLEFIYFLRPASALEPWFRIIRSPLGTIRLERHLEESDERAVHLWMGFDLSFR